MSTNPMDLSTELRRIQQEKHKKNNNQTTNNIQQQTNNIKPIQKKDEKKEIIQQEELKEDNDTEMKENEIMDDDENSTSNKIDWDLEMATQLQRQYGGTDEDNDSIISNNNHNINYQNSQSVFNNLMSDENDIPNIFQQMHQSRNNNNNNNNGNSNGGYSFSFSSSSNGPRGFSMVFSSSNNNGNENAEEIFNALRNRGMGMGMNDALFGNIFNRLNINGMEMNNNNNNNIPENMDFEQLLNMFPIINRGLNENEINNNSVVDKFKAKKVEKDPKKETKDNKKSKIDENSKSCCICMDEFKDNDEIRRLPCLHIFHKDEIDKWLKTKDSCPICRESIKQNN